MDYFLQFVLVFFCVLIADVCWAMYFDKIAKGQSVWAGMWGAAVIICSAVTVTEYIHDHTLIIAAAIGGCVGTIITVEYNKRKKK